MVGGWQGRPFCVHCPHAFIFLLCACTCVMGCMHCTHLLISRVDWCGPGAAIFGLGWGIAGLCPGPSLVLWTAGYPKVNTHICILCTYILCIYNYIVFMVGAACEKNQSGCSCLLSLFGPENPPTLEILLKIVEINILSFLENHLSAGGRGLHPVHAAGHGAPGRRCTAHGQAEGAGPRAHLTIGGATKLRADQENDGSRFVGVRPCRSLKVHQHQADHP